MPLYVLFHSPGPAWDPDLPYTDQPGISDHVGFMRGLEDRGVLVLGGPFNTASGGEPVGMAVVEADDLPTAQALAEEDPSLGADLLWVEVRAWNPRMGRALGDETARG